MKHATMLCKRAAGGIMSLAVAFGMIPFMGTEAKADEVVKEWDFEDGLEDWISVDADGDGENWFFASSLLEAHPDTKKDYFVHGGDESLISRSYIADDYRSLDPDNWLISPEVQLGGYISFYANAVDNSYPDHIGVFVSTGDREDLDSYVLVEDWTLEDRSTADDEDSKAVWEQYTVSLEDYEGAGYVAIRHYESYDKFVLAIDDIKISSVSLDHIEAESTGFNGVYDGEPHGITVNVTDPDSFEILYGTEEGYYSLNESPVFDFPGTYTVYYKITAEGYLPLYGSEDVVIEAPSGYIFQNFEDSCEDWTFIDNDGDGNQWIQAKYDNDMVLASYSYNSEALDPDNWFISPAVELGGAIAFYGQSYHSSYPDHIGVFVTTGDIDDLDSYELVDDLVLASEWTLYSFDLSEYSGEGYIAIRHYNSSNQYIALIDNIMIVPRETVAVEGWIQDGSAWFYFEDGEAVTGWKKIENVWYFFGEDGAMTTGWLKDGDSWYYFKSSGAMAKGWTKISGKWYYFTSGGKMKTGWLQDGSKWYYLKDNGDMATGWTKVSGKWYYMGTDGVMKTGWVKDAGKWYYMDSNGTMHTGWLQIGSKWYYMNSSGVMVTGTQTINGKTYTFDSNGVWIK
ncbi:MAG: choice-of-anchor J domain-containing protein [Clostridiales bacterium]|nr:choice-of-anchor J domain-containing protein [Clostridiales bacterium]